MEPPKFQPASPNLETGLDAVLAFRPVFSRPRVLRFPTWKVDFFDVPGSQHSPSFLAVGVGQPESVEFDHEARDATIRWLASPLSKWLDDLLLATAALPGQAPRPELTPHPALVAESLRQLFSSAGDLGLSAETTIDGSPRFAVPVVPFAQQLRSLRSGVLFAVGFGAAEKPAQILAATARAMEKREPGIAAQIHGLVGGEAAASALLPRLFMLSGMAWLLQDRLFEPESLVSPMRVAEGPVSPLLEVWFVAAVTVGAIVPPYPIPGVYRCSYHLCQRVFVSDKRGVVGTRRFCCDRHNKSYYAARRMKEKSQKIGRKPPSKE